MRLRAVPVAILIWVVPPHAFAAQPAPTGAESGASPPAAAAPVPPDPAIEAAADAVRLAVGAGGHLAFGSAPAVAVGVHLSVEVDTARWSLGLEGRYDLPAGAHTTQGGTARTSLAGASFLPCVRAKGLWACGVVLASRVKADGTDANGVTASDASLFLGIGARLQMHFALPLDFALRIGGEVLGHPIPYELVANGQRVFKSSSVSMMIGPTLVRAF